MNTREKLIELLMASGEVCFTQIGEEIADHLIANGVTVQEWISVKDRLPEQTDPATAVLGITERGRCHIVYYFKGATSEEFTGFYDICAKREITHWMPLPQPPNLGNKQDHQLDECSPQTE